MLLGGLVSATSAEIAKKGERLRGSAAGAESPWSNLSKNKKKNLSWQQNCSSKTKGPGEEGDNFWGPLPLPAPLFYC